MSGPPVYSFMKKINWTPLSLGSKLLNWWDGTIVDEDPATEVNSWVDQKGSFDWQNIGAAKKPEYDSANKLIIFDAANEERLSNDANVASFNRSSGEYWFVNDHIGAVSQHLINLTWSASLDWYFQLMIFSNRIRILTKAGGTQENLLSTTLPILGRNIIRIFSNGSSYSVELNGVDISSEFSAGTGRWESFVSVNADKVSVGAFIRTAADFQNNRTHAILRCDENMTSEDVTNLYNYLNKKY